MTIGTDWHSESERAIARQKDYIGACVVTFLLYASCFFWIPGVIINIMYLSAARKTRDVSGVEPTGRFGLQLMLFLFFVLPLVAFVVFINVVFIIGLFASGV